MVESAGKCGPILWYPIIFNSLSQTPCRSVAQVSGVLNLMEDMAGHELLVKPVIEGHLLYSSTPFFTAVGSSAWVRSHLFGHGLGVGGPSKARARALDSWPSLAKAVARSSSCGSGGASGSRLRLGGVVSVEGALRPLPATVHTVFACRWSVCQRKPKLR